MPATNQHTVIIGSGAGGLVTGLLLARAGHRVTVLEQHRIIGGCLQCFTRRGVKFDTGMHFIGSAMPGQSLWHIWDALGLNGNVPLSELDRKGYNTIHLRGEQFRMANSREAFIEGFASRFPAERRGLEKYYDAVEAVASASMLSASDVTSPRLDSLLRYQSVPVDGFIADTIRDTLLREALVGDLPLHAPRRGMTPFAQHAFITDFYNRSAFRIIGGSDIIATQLASNIERLGGRVITSARVTAVKIRDGKATGVEISGIDGSKDLIETDNVISDIHPARLMDLVEPGTLRPVFRSRIKSMPNTTGSFCLYLIFKEGRVPYEATNHFAYSPEVSPWDCENYKQEDWPRGYLYMHQAHQGAASGGFARSAVVISFMHGEETSRWAGLSPHRRGEEYENFKAAKADRLLARLTSDFPALRGNIEYFEASTPATFESYTGTPGGSLYGVLRDINAGAAGRVPYRTRVPNLFLTGQNVNSHGILGVSVGAVMTASHLTGAPEIMRILNTPLKSSSQP